MYAVHTPTEGIQHRENACKANVAQTSMGEGTLYITESEVVWCTSENTGFRMQYRDIAIHAISTDLQAFPEGCLYVMHNDKVLHTGTNEASDDEDDSVVTEVRFVPSNTENLKAMFNAMSDCQCLHPDEDDSDFSAHDEDESSVINYADGAAGEGFFTGEEGLNHMTPQGLATMQRLEAMLARNVESGDGLPEDVNGLNLNGEDEEGQFDDA